jgi:hypothetical protein
MSKLALNKLELPVSVAEKIRHAMMYRRNILQMLKSAWVVLMQQGIQPPVFALYIRIMFLVSQDANQPALPYIPALAFQPLGKQLL